MTTVRLWKQKPTSDVAMRRKIQRALGHVSKFADVQGPDGINVRVTVARIYRKYWKDEPKRWNWVPVILPSIHSAHRITNQPQERTRLYSSMLTVVAPDGSRQQTSYATYISDHGNDRLSWKTTFPPRGGLAALQQREKVGRGYQIWPSPPIAVTRRKVNPVPEQPSFNYSTRAGNSSRVGRLLLIVGGLWLLNRMAQRQEVA